MEKFFIYCRRRWRELDITTGLVEGINKKMQFLYVRNGAIELLQKQWVLGEFQKYVAGHPSKLVEGPRLPLEPRIRRRKLRRHRDCDRDGTPEHHSCNQKEGTPKRDATDTYVEFTYYQHSPRAKEHQKRQSTKQISPKKDAAVQTEIIPDYPTRALATSDSSSSTCSSTSTASTKSMCLYVERDDVDCIKRCLAANPGFLGELDPNRYDLDQDYRLEKLYKVNPVVSLAKEKRIDKIAIESQKIGLKKFAKCLGLRPIDDVENERRRSSRLKEIGGLKEDNGNEKAVNSTANGSFSDRNVVTKQTCEDKRERFLKQKTNNTLTKEGAKELRNEEHKTAPALANEGAKELRNSVQKTTPMVTDEDAKERRRRNLEERTSSAKRARPYEPWEDRQIAQWVCVGGRARDVSGNRIWMSLAQEFESRTWQSLRNRYLRYLLPALSAPHLALTSAQQARLRADAASGSLNLPRKRRNSLLNRPAPPVGAWARRPRTPPPAATPAAQPLAASSPHRTGKRNEPTRDETPSTEVSSPKRRRVISASEWESYSALTRAFARRRRSPRHSPATAGSDATDTDATSATLRDSAKQNPPTSRSRRLYNPR